MSYKTDETYIRFKLILKNASNIDLDKTYEEIGNLHSGRTMRSLKGGKIGAKQVIAAAIQDQSYRSRLVELNIHMSKEFNALKIAYEATKDHLNSKFGKDIGVRSIADRDAYWRSKLTKAVRRLDALGGMIEIAEQVIEDIDKASFSVKHVLQGLELATRPEINL